MKYEERTQLINELEDAKYYFSAKNELYQQVIEIEEQNNKLNFNLQYARNNKIVPTIALFPIAVILLCLIYQFYALIESVIKFPGSGYVYLSLVGITFVAALVLMVVMNKKLSKNKVVKLEDDAKRLSEQQNNIVNILNSYYLEYSNPSLLPFKYTYPGMIDILIDYVRDHRASNVQDSINQYLDDSHKQRMEESQRNIERAVKNTNSSVKSSRNWAAAGTVISVLGLFKK